MRKEGEDPLWVYPQGLHAKGHTAEGRDSRR